MDRKENSNMLTAPDGADLLPGNNVFLVLDEQSRKYTFLCFIKDVQQIMVIDSVSNPEKMPDGDWHAIVNVNKGSDPLGFLFASSFDFAIESDVDPLKKLVIDIRYAKELNTTDEVVSVDFTQTNAGNDQLEKIAKYLVAKLSEVKVVFSQGKTSTNYKVESPYTESDDGLQMNASWSLDQYHLSNKLDSSLNPRWWHIYLTKKSSAGGSKNARSSNFRVTKSGDITTKIFVADEDTNDDDEKKYNPSNPRLQLLELLRRIFSVLR